MNKSDGFTLVELVVIIIILGILSAFALPRFFNLSQYQQRAAYDEVAAALRYAQKLAVGSGCAVQVVFAGNTYALQQRAGCATGAFATIAGHPIDAGDVAGVNLNSVPATFIFDPMGRCLSTPPAPTITVGGRIINVIASTGAVDAQ